MNGQELITLKGFQKLRSELESLTQKERPEILKTIAWAAGNGDRSENADYQYGKKKLREIERRLRFLTKRLAVLRPIDINSLKSEKIQFGATVVLETEEGNEKTVSLVGSDEVDPKRGLISLNSPLGKSLVGCAVGDEVEVQAPKGLVLYTVLDFFFKEVSDDH